MISAERLKELRAYHESATKVLHSGSPFKGIHGDSAEAIIELEAARARIAELTDDFVDAEACATVLRQQLAKLRAQGLSQEDRAALEAGARFCFEHAAHLSSDDGVDRHTDIPTYRNYAAILRRLGGQTI